MRTSTSKLSLIERVVEGGERAAKKSLHAPATQTSPQHGHLRVDGRASIDGGWRAARRGPRRWQSGVSATHRAVLNRVPTDFNIDNGLTGAPPLESEDSPTTRQQQQAASSRPESTTQGSWHGVPRALPRGHPMRSIESSVDPFGLRIDPDICQRTAELLLSEAHRDSSPQRSTHTTHTQAASSRQQWAPAAAPRRRGRSRSRRRRLGAPRTVALVDLQRMGMQMPC